MKGPSSTSLFLRKQWLSALGGVQNPIVKNSEWLHLLEEETRNTLMIEGEFDNPEELQKVIDGNPDRKGKGAKIVGVWEAANLMYEVAFQQNKDGVFELPMYLIRAGHGALTKFDPTFVKNNWKPGNFRMGNNIITGIPFKTPDYTRVPEFMEKISWLALKQKTWTPWRRAAVLHAFFEHIHPFPDGNGRLGRILANFILVAHGFPNVAIKFEQKNEYEHALAQADPFIKNVLQGKLAWTKFPYSSVSELEFLFALRLTKTMDRLICNRWENIGKNLLPLPEIAQITGRSAGALSVSASNKQIIAVKNGQQWMSHPDFLAPPKK